MKHKNIQLFFVPSLLAATGKKDGTSKTALAGKQDMSVSTVSGNEGTQNGQRLFSRERSWMTEQGEIELEPLW